MSKTTTKKTAPTMKLPAHNAIRTEERRTAKGKPSTKTKTTVAAVARGAGKAPKKAAGLAKDDDLFARASKAYGEWVLGTEYTPQEPSYSLSGLNTSDARGPIYELRNIRGILASYRLKSAPRLIRVYDRE